MINTMPVVPNITSNLKKGRYGSYYETPEKSFYSVTAVLRHTMDSAVREKIENAAQRKIDTLGKQRAYELSAADVCRGNAVHNALREYFQDGEINVEPIHQGFIQALEPILSGIRSEDCLGVEEYACHPPLGYACRMDLRCLWGGVHTIVELKTSSKGMPQAWLGEKILQVAAERMAFNYFASGSPVEQVMVINAFSSDGVSPGTNIYIIKGRELEAYEEEWLARHKKFESLRDEICPTPAYNF